MQGTEEQCQVQDQENVGPRGGVRPIGQRKATMDEIMHYDNVSDSTKGEPRGSPIHLSGEQQILKKSRGCGIDKH